MKAIHVEGFKSFFESQRIALADVTVFAGANSSGKSSAMQPLLLMKQTLESQYDPGSLLLEGPNIKFTSLEQMLSKGSGVVQKKNFTVGVELDSDLRIEISYSRKEGLGVEVKTVRVKDASGIDLTYRDSKKFSDDESDQLYSHNPQARIIQNSFSDDSRMVATWEAVTGRCFPDLRLVGRFSQSVAAIELYKPAFQERIRKHISELIHIQGLRGNPERIYSSTARVSRSFPGVFTDYFASVLHRWHQAQDTRLDQVGADLRKLGLSWKVRTTPVQDTKVEIRVSRLPHATQGGAHDLVNIADVGLGVSQILPFLVALRAAKKGQVVFVEQPEIHLHPRAQAALVDVILEAAGRGVRVWLETHSAPILRGFQTKVAEGVLPSSSLALNWFSRHSVTGATVVSVANVGPLGQYGAWPVDFDDVSLEIERHFLDAVSRHAFPAEQIKNG